MQDAEIATLARVMLDSHGARALAKALDRVRDNEARGYPAAADLWHRTAAAIRQIAGEGMAATG